MEKLMFISLLLLFVGVQAQEDGVSAPSWYKNPPKSGKKYYGAGVGTSKSLEVAEKKALLDANTSLAEQSGKIKIEENNSSNAYCKQATVAEESNVRTKKNKHTYDVEVSSEQSGDTSNQGLNNGQANSYTKTIVAKLSNVRLLKKEVIQDGENYTVYVLVEMKRAGSR
mgnify:FL=1